MYCVLCMKYCFLTTGEPFSDSKGLIRKRITAKQNTVAFLSASYSMNLLVYNLKLCNLKIDWFRENN